MVQVVRGEDCALWRREHQFAQDVVLSAQEGFQQPLVAEFD
jgi:hypothetical protein